MSHARNEQFRIEHFSSLLVLKGRFPYHGVGALLLGWAPLGDSVAYEEGGKAGGLGRGHL